MERRKVWYLVSLTSSGKTTLMKFLQETGFMVVDTSALLTQWGEVYPMDRAEIRHAILNGQAVPDTIVNNAVSRFLVINRETDCLISGYPRTEGQAKHAITVLDPLAEQHFVYLNTPEEVCRMRFAAAQKNGGREQRPDGDRADIAERRFERDTKNIPLTIRYLETCNLFGRFHEIIGTQSTQEVFEDLQSFMGLSRSVFAS